MPECSTATRYAHVRICRFGIDISGSQAQNQQESHRQISAAHCPTAIIAGRECRGGLFQLFAAQQPLFATYPAAGAVESLSSHHAGWQRERGTITLDVDLSFDWQETQQALPNLVIAEVKQPGRQQSPFIQKMRMAHIHEVSFSKCASETPPDLPNPQSDRFRQRQIDKLLQFPLWSGRMH